MSVKRRTQFVYGINDNLIALSPEPIVSSRAPTSNDKAEVGTMWVDTTLDDVYVVTKVANNTATWINCGGGSGIFSALTVNPGNATITAGNLAVTAGNFSVGGTVTFGAMTHGVLTSNAVGLISSTPLTNGQIIIGATGGAVAAATLTAGAGIGIVNGANTITISAPGATAVSYVTDVAGPVLPDGAGAVNVVGGTNIGTDGTVANTITINLDPSVVLAGKLTAGVDLEMSSGTCTITSNTNAANAIYLHANAGVNETIHLYSQLGTSVTSLYLQSAVGGITFDSGLASADAINITASNAAGGIDIDAGTAGINVAAANGPITIISGTGAVGIANDATAHALTLGSATGAASTTIQAGTGNLVQTSTGTITLDSAGVLELNSSAGIISIGNDAVAQNINLGTGAAARTITIGNATGATSVILNAGTGNVELGINGTAHATSMGSTAGASATTVQAGTGALAINGGGVVTVDSVGVLELNSSAGVIGIGNDAVAQNINIGTGAAARIITIGNATGATSTVINVGTGNLDLGVTATAHTTRVGSTTGASASTLQAGTGLLSVNGGGIVEIDAVGVLELNSSAGVISIGNDAVAQNINIGTGAAARLVTVGNMTGASSTRIQSGTGDIVLDSADAITIGAAGDTTIDAVGTLELNSSGAAIRIGNDANAFDIAIGTGAAQRTITIGNATAATSVIVNGGTGAMQFGANAVAHTTTIGSATGNSMTVIQAGTDDLELTSTGEITLDAADVLEINCSGAAISIGNDANAFGINVGTGAAARTIEIGNNTGATAINLSAGSGEVNSDTDINLTTAGTGFVTQEGPRVIAGTGSPHGAIVAAKGSLYLRTDGSGVNDRAYINTDGANAWTAIVTVA